MQTLPTSPIASIAYDQTKYLFTSTPVRNVSGLFKSLTEKGLDRLTGDKIEHIICTSALAAFN